MGDTPRTLRTGFLGSVERFPDRPALALQGQATTYAELHSMACALAATVDGSVSAAGLDEPEPLTAVLGQRSVSAFAGVLAALLRGHGYVPLNPAFPAPRTRAMLERSGSTTLIVDGGAVRQLDAILGDLDRPLAVVVPDESDVGNLQRRLPRHHFFGANDVLSGEGYAPRSSDPNALAYLLFTSGSTGQPKGVMVAHRNVTAFVDAMCDRYAITEHDRLSNTFDLTFDLSVFDMFVSWERGACLCVPTAQQKMFPGKYIKASELTVWFSVPSTGALMNQLRMLKPGSYPALRLSLFCGEALPAELAKSWQAAAPNSTVENLYGPTELTIACTLYRWDPERSPAECEIGVVPIGEPYPGMDALVADEQLREVPPGEAGELLMTGPQMALGYWKDPARTAQAFVRPPGREAVYYRTGDRVRRPAGEAPLVYLGRVDNQIKVQGYRVELGEIEAVMRAEAGVDVAIAVGWPLTASGADGVVGFVQAGARDPDTLLARVRERLPPYMQPSKLRLVDRFPLNPNGKVDRKVLQHMLEEGD